MENRPSDLPERSGKVIIKPERPSPSPAPRLPEVEPEIRYSLYSDNMEVSHRRVNSSSDCGAKWQKRGNLGSSPLKGVANVRLDSYVPVGSPLSRVDRGIDHGVDRNVDRGIERPGRGASHTIDSYRPLPSRDIPTAPKAYRSSSSLRITASGPSSHSVTPNNAVAVDSTHRTSTTTYMSKEHIMEKKAMGLGVRRKFFQYLQKKRDEVRAEHPNCSSEYRHWAADNSVWVKIFKEPFPYPPPTGSNLHSTRCSETSFGPQALRVSERAISSQLTLQAPTSSSARLASLARSKATPSSSDRSSSQITPFESLNTSENTTSSRPLKALVIELNSRRLLTQLNSQTKATMINKRIMWTTSASVKRVADSFTTIDANLMDAVENELKCHLRSFQTPSGDLILWNEAFLANDKASYDRGSRFLNGWFDFANRADNAPFSSYWNQFKESEKIEEHSVPSGGSPMILVYNQVIKCSMFKCQEVLRLFHTDKPGLDALEATLKCRFAYSFHTPDQKIIEIRASPNSNKANDSWNDEHKRLNSFLYCWVSTVVNYEPSQFNLEPSRYWNNYIVSDFGKRLIDQANPSEMLNDLASSQQRSSLHGLSKRKLDDVTDSQVEKRVRI